MVSEAIGYPRVLTLTMYDAVPEIPRATHVAAGDVARGPLAKMHSGLRLWHPVTHFHPGWYRLAAWATLSPLPL